MRKLYVIAILLGLAVAGFAQETHYHKGLRSQEENDKYGTAASDPNFNGGGYYWSRVRNVDDMTVDKETPADSLARIEAFKRLCRKAYDAYEAGDAMNTVLYGDSALQNKYHTPDLYFFMGVSFEKLGNYDDADWAYKKAVKTGYMAAPKAYLAFKDRMKQRKAEEKQRRKEEKKRRQSH